MIGQSGLPMMNKLAGSNEKAPEEVQAKPGASEAGAFEKALMPDALADGQPTPPEAAQAAPPVDARTGGRMAAPDQVGAAPFFEPQLMPSAEGAPPTSRDLLQQAAQPMATSSNTGQSSGGSDQILPTSAKDGGAEPQVSDVTTQTSKPDDNTATRETLEGDAELDAVDARQAQLENQSPLIGLAQEAGALTSSPARPEITVPSAEMKAGLQANGPEVRPSQQVLQASTAASSDPGAGSAATTQGNAMPDADLTLSKAEAATSLAGTQSSEMKNLSQTELAQLRPTGPQSLSDFRAAAASASASSQPGSAATTPSGPSSAVEVGEQKLAVHAPTPPVQALASDTSSLALGSLSERSEVLVGATATVTSTASSRLDAPAAALSSVDPKQVVHQINQAIIRMDGARTEVLLDPVELGRVSLTFITKDEGVTVLINADRSETADLLRRHGEQLQRDLSNSGYEDVELDFGQGDDPHQDPSGADRFDDTAAVASTAVSYEANFITSGLDIRI